MCGLVPAKSVSTLLMLCEVQSIYAVVTLWRAAGNRRVLVLSGFDTWGTLAAAEYVTEPEHLRQLNQHLAECRERAGAPEHAPYFQVLLRAEVKDNQPVAISYVTHHDLDVPSSVNGTLAGNRRSPRLAVKLPSI